MANRTRKVVIKQARVNGELGGKHYFPQSTVRIDIDFPPSKEGLGKAQTLLYKAYTEAIKKLSNVETID